MMNSLKNCKYGERDPYYLKLTSLLLYCNHKNRHLHYCMYQSLDQEETPGPRACFSLQKMGEAIHMNHADVLCQQEDPS